MPSSRSGTGWGHGSVEETEGYLHRGRASHARAVNRLDAYVECRRANRVMLAAPAPSGSISKS